MVPKLISHPPLDAITSRVGGEIDYPKISSQGKADGAGNHRTAFTLVELPVVISIIALIIALLLPALALAGAASVPAGAAPANMVTNPGFETGHFTAWKSYGSWRISNNPADVHSGKYAAVNNLTVSVGTTSTTYSGLYQNISDPDAAGQAFNASAWISTAATNGYSKSFFQVQFQNSSGKVLKQYDTAPVTVDQAYAQYALSNLVAPPGTAIIEVQGVVEGIGGRTPASNNTGYTRFDDFSLTPVPEPGSVAPARRRADVQERTTGRAAAQFPYARLTVSEKVMLKSVERRCFRYFWDEMNPRNGLVPNRAPVAGGPAPVASIAATGFGLTALCIADEHHWEPHAEIYSRVLRTLDFFRYKAQSAHGFYYHFLGMRSGRRLWHCSASSIDTALLMAGVLTVRQHFAGTAAARVATSIYRRVDWPWMLNSNFMPNGEKTLAMGWRPGSGFIHYNWFQFNEGPLIYLLGIGSRTHPLPPSSWSAWRRGPLITYAGYTFMNGTSSAPAPLFTHQYLQGWFNLRGLCDNYADYFRDSRYATLANRTMCVNLAKRFPDYGPNSWGISASLSPSGYRAWGEPPPTLTGPNAINGTLVPCAAGGSIPFVPKRCIQDLIAMRKTFRKLHIYGRYGFVDAFNPLTGWVAKDLRGIDQGITLVMAENYRTGFVWRNFRADPVAKRALHLAGFHKMTAADVLPKDTSIFSR